MMSIQTGGIGNGMKRLNDDSVDLNRPQTQRERQKTAEASKREQTGRLLPMLYCCHHKSKTSKSKPFITVTFSSSPLSQR